MNRFAHLGCCIAAVALVGLLLTPASALYIRPDIEKVPVQRLIDNLSEQIKKDPKNARAHFNLARVHAMAYALKTDTAESNKATKDGGAWFGFEPAHIPFQVKKTDDAKQLEEAKKHLDEAVAEYKKVLELEPANLSALLGHAWTLDQAKGKETAIKEYRAVIETAWAKEKDMKSAPLGWHSVTAEAAKYLIPYLDKEKDKEEIATLEERTKKLRMLPRPITPIVIPLEANLRVQDVEALDARVKFDADGSGLRKTWSWITPKAGWLVYDSARTGKVTSALQMFGSVTFWCFWDDGYQALAALDDNGDGVLTGKELAGLAIWHDKNGDGICDPDEVKPLADWGIVALSCRAEVDRSHRDRILYAPRGVFFRDGSVRPTWDIVLRQK
jgi:hypothetical protein